MFKAFDQKPCISKNRASSRLLVKNRVSLKKTVHLQGFWPKTVHLKCFGIQLKTVYLQGPCSSRPCILRPCCTAKAILSATSTQFFRYLWFILLGVCSLWLKSLVTKKAWVKDFLQICSKNCISLIFGLFFENVHKWKPHNWNSQEPRTRCRTLAYFCFYTQKNIYFQSTFYSMIQNMIM